MPAKAGTQIPPPGRPAPPAALDPHFRGGDDKRSQDDVSGSYHYDLPRIVEIYNHMVATLIVPTPASRKAWFVKYGGQPTADPDSRQRM